MIEPIPMAIRDRFVWIYVLLALLLAWTLLDATMFPTWYRTPLSNSRAKHGSPQSLEKRWLASRLTRRRNTANRACDAG